MSLPDDPVTSGNGAPKKSPEQIREEWLANFNKNRASRGKPALTPYEVGKRHEWELIYRDSGDAAERQRAYEEIQRQDVTPDVQRPASAAAVRDHRARIAAMLGTERERAAAANATPNGLDADGAPW